MPGVALIVGGCLAAWGFARSIDSRHPSLKTRERSAQVVEHPDELGYFMAGDLTIPDTPDELLAKIDAAKAER